jgi:uncharacterized protein with ParB-like and HNH nuclease domain
MRLSGEDSTREYVLDGQQRLQSLYIALYGSYEGKELYFNIQSFRTGENGYEFQFLEKPNPFWIRVKDIVLIGANFELILIVERV